MITLAWIKERCKVNEETGCWEWTMGKYRRGYGAFTYKQKKRSVHRWVYADQFGSIPEGMFVCHHCDNPPCCNPGHLFLGTPKDNMRDMIQKGRANRSHNVLKSRPGTSNHNAKMTPEKIIEIREKYASGKSSYRSLGAEYGLAFASVRDIIKHINWKQLV